MSPVERRSLVIALAITAVIAVALGALVHVSHERSQTRATAPVITSTPSTAPSIPRVPCRAAVQRLPEARATLMRSLQSREKTAAIIGNLIIESCLDPAANQKESGSYGIAQWSRPEETNLIQNQENVLRQRSTPLQTQLEYLVQDYQKDPYRRYNGGYKEFMATSSLEEATTFFMKDYLKPGIPLTNRRVTYAQWAMDQPWPSPTPAR